MKHLLFVPLFIIMLFFSFQASSGSQKPRPPLPVFEQCSGRLASTHNSYQGLTLLRVKSNHRTVC